VEVDAALLLEARAARDRLAELQAEAEERRAEFHQSVRRLHSAGMSMRDVAEALGMSHQRVHQIIRGGKGMAAPERRGTLLRRLVRRTQKGGDPAVAPMRSGELVLDRFFVDARDALSLAGEEARALNHGYLGTEHLLLGLLRGEHGLAARLLEAVGADLDQARMAVRALVGVLPTAAGADLRPTPRLKKVLELARQEAKSLRVTHVRTEHLLLGLAREGGGLGARVLTDLGVGYEQLRRRIDRAAVACSFCGRSGLDAAHLVAGPGIYICERCVEAAGLIERPDSGREVTERLTLVHVDRVTAACSFCGKRREEVGRLVAAGPHACICGDCLALCREIVEEREAFVPGRG
jgi:hypothetical protein